jgi:DNA-binding transcriptional MerR regulator
VIASPERGDNNYRDYDESVIAELEFIQKAQPLGFGLAEIATILGHMRDSSLNCLDGMALVDAKLADVDQRMRELHLVRQMLTSTRDELEISAKAHGLTVPAPSPRNP